MPNTSFDYDSAYMPSAPVATIQLRAKSTVELVALLDSGADGTMIPANVLRQIGARYQETRTMRGVTGARQTVDLYLVTVQIDPHKITGIRAAAVTVGSEVILGRDVLNHLVVTLNGLAGVTEIAH
jgi:predicted aspartyl protease